MTYDGLHKLVPAIFRSKLHPRPGKTSVFRFKEEGARLKGKFRPPKKDAPAPSELAPWQDLTEAEAREAVLAGQSLLISGPPGCGKSYLVAEILAISDFITEKITIAILAKTHASVANFNSLLIAHGSELRAPTADHWANATVRRGVCSTSLLVLEEITMLNSHLWDEISKAALKCPQIVAIGDFKQFGACADTYAGSPVTASLEASDILHQLCGGQRLILTGNRRSDETLFRFYTSITEDFQESLRNASLECPVTAWPSRTPRGWQ